MSALKPMHEVMPGLKIIRRLFEDPFKRVFVCFFDSLLASMNIRKIQALEETFVRVFAGNPDTELQ